MGYMELKTIGDICDHAEKYFASTWFKENADELQYQGSVYMTDNPSLYFFIASRDLFDNVGDLQGQLFQVYMYHRGNGQVSDASNRFSTLRLAEMAALLLVDKIDKQSQPAKPASPKREIIPAWRPF